MNNNYKIILSLDLQLFAKEGPGGEKTEDATSKKLSDVRNEGNVAKSQEIVTAATFFALFVSLKFLIGFIGKQLLVVFDEFYSMIPSIVTTGIDKNEFYSVLLKALFYLGISTLPFFLIGFVLTFFSTSIQFKFKVTTKPLEPKFNKMNPISGFKRMFSLNTFVELIKSVFKIILIGYIAYSIFKEHAKDLYLIYDISLMNSILLMYNIIMELLIKITFLFSVIGSADFLYQKWKFKNDNKMTKQEVKDEFKNQEGDPKVKGQQKQRMMQASQRRMMSAIPQADVVITNPTHFAVALSYEAGVGSAPVVVAKGADFLAAKIKDIAREHQVEIVENKPLARMLYYNVDLGAEIPPELYQAVAEVLAYVYQIKNKVG